MVKKKYSSGVLNMLRKRAEFYKKHPGINERRIASMIKKLRTKKERIEMGIAKKKYYKQHPEAREYYKIHPEARKRMSIAKRLQYAKNPRLRLKTSRAMKKFYSRNPQVARLIAKKLKERYKNHPYLREKLRKEKQLYYENHPEALRNLLAYSAGKKQKRIIANGDLIVKSKGEKIIAETLAKSKISPNYESIELNFPEMDPIPDFYPDDFNIFIEFYGGHPKSWKTKVEKNTLYKKYKIPVLKITPGYLKDIKFERNLLRDIKQLSGSVIARSFKLEKWELKKQKK